MTSKQKYDKQRYLDHGEQIKKLTRVWRKNNLEKSLLNVRMWFLTHREYRQKYNRQWFKKYPWLCSYYAAKYRCENLKRDSYKYYGDRGIKFLMTKEDFKFLWFRDEAYLLKRPSIDRINGNGNYELSNCRYIELVTNIKRQDKKQYGNKRIYSKT